MTQRHETVLRIKVEVTLTFWQALKLRLAGATYVKAYVEHAILRRAANDEEDDYPWE